MMWLHPPDDLTLGDAEAHVWRVNMDAHQSMQSSFLQLLSPDEKARAHKFRLDKDRNYYTTARGILRLLIGKYLQVNAAALAFEYSAFGKPFIAGNNQLQFNISHAQNIALFAFTKGLPLGVDVEFVNDTIELEDIASKFFSANEVQQLMALPAGQRPLGFFNCWTRKEAFIKAVGEGLSFPLDSFEVSLQPGKPAALLATHWDPAAVEKWSVYSFSPADNFVGSIVVEGFIQQLKYWNW